MIVIRIDLFDYIDETFAGRYVRPAVFLVVEDIIRITGTINHSNLFARLCIEHCKARWFAEANEQPVMRFV